MSSEDGQKRPCFEGESVCSDCDGSTAECSKNFCKDLGINIPELPEQQEPSEEYQKMVKMNYELAVQTMWLQKQYGFTTKTELITDITEAIFIPAKRNILIRLLEESAWQLAHLQLVISRMSEDYADLTLVAGDMGKALEKMFDASSALAEWRAFAEWLYTDPDADEEIYDQDADNEEEA